MKEKFIFIDTFALSQFMKECEESFVNYLKINNFIIAFTSIQLVELYNPRPELDSRIKDMVRLFSIVPFAIIDQMDIVRYEEYLYPRRLKDIPVRLRSDVLFKGKSNIFITNILEKIFTIGLPEHGVPLVEWVEKYSLLKSKWSEDVKNIINNAQITKTISNKDKFVQSLDLRLCDNIVKIMNEMDPIKRIDLNPNNMCWIKKIKLIIEKHDTYIMSGIHLSSLAFWYEYIVANKEIHGSDIGDFYYMILLPYCSLSIVDKSRHDCLLKIKKIESMFINLNVFNKKEFVKLLLSQH